MNTHDTFPGHDQVGEPGIVKLRVSDLPTATTNTLPHQTDRVERPEGHFMGSSTYAALIAQWGVGVRRVPSPFWMLDGTAAVVSCPCGESPVVEALGPFAECPCARFFFFDGSDVWAYNTPPSTEAATME